jgi:hypothetical protein
MPFAQVEQALSQLFDTFLCHSTTCREPCIRHTIVHPPVLPRSSNIELLKLVECLEPPGTFSNVWIGRLLLYSMPLSLACCLLQAIYGHPEVGNPAVRGGREKTTQKRLNDVGYRQESESVHRDLPGLR